MVLTAVALAEEITAAVQVAAMVQVAETEPAARAAKAAVRMALLVLIQANPVPYVLSHL